MQLRRTMVIAQGTGAVLDPTIMRWWWAIGLGAIGACGADDDGRLVGRPMCAPTGKASACPCSDGRMGAQRCQEDGTFAECVCTDVALAGLAGAKSAVAMNDGLAGAMGVGGASSDGGHDGIGKSGGAGAEHVPLEACDLGDVAGCPCDGKSGRRFCVEGTFGECVCAVPSTTSGSGEGGAAGAAADIGCEESSSCDGTEPDCRRARLACPSEQVANTLPFAEGVYLEGTLSEGAAGRDAIQQFFPKPRLTYFTGFTDGADFYRFRPTDGALAYHDRVRGILVNGTAANTSDDVVQLTPPCGNAVAAGFAFDGSGVLHYRCGDTLRRANGEPLARDVLELAGVIGDGRSIVARTGPAYAVVSAGGLELARLYPRELFTGSVTLLPLASTARSSTAYVAFARVYNAGTEIVVYAVDEDSRLRLVRRAPVLGLGESQLVISDGTIFVREYDDTTTFDDRIRAYLPDGSTRIVWREAEAVDVLSHVGTQLLTGALP